jgi:hypothetical protein
MAVSHAHGVLNNHVPDLDIGILSKGYACTPAEAQALADQVRPIVEPFVERLGLSVSSASEDAVRVCTCNGTMIKLVMCICKMQNWLGRFAPSIAACECLLSRSGLYLVDR